MAVLLSLITSLLWGTSDFFGGLAARRVPVARVMLWAHGVGLVAIAIASPILAERLIARDLLIGVAAGLVGLVGLLLLYGSLARGPMSIVAPLSALTAALVPILWGLGSDDPPSGVTLIGLVIGLVAVVAISWEGTDDEQPTALQPQVFAAAIVAGICFGSIVLLYDATDEAAAPWPIASGRFATLLLLVLFALSRRERLLPADPSDSSVRFAVAAGLGDTFANVTLLLATGAAATSSELSVVAVVSAFYPAATVLWARKVLNEPLGPIRIAGLLLGLAAITLMTLG